MFQVPGFKFQEIMLKQAIHDDLERAVRKKDEIARSTLRLLLAAILNKEKEKKYKEKIEGEPELNDEEIIEVISSEVKKRKEAIVEFEKGKREDLVEKEKAEMEVLKKYLPEQLSEGEIKKLAKEVIKKTGAKEPKDMGKVMGEIMPQVKGKADGSLVSKIIKELLVLKDE